MATFIELLEALSPDVIWELDDASGATGATIADSSGNGRNGTVVGTLTPTTWFIPNENTSAMRSTNAVNGRVSLNDAAWMTATNTTGFWAVISYKPNSESFSSQRDIFGKMDMWQLWQETSGRVTAYITPAWTGLLSVGAAGILAVDTPYLIVLRKNSTHWSLWINGVKNAEVAHASSPADSTGPLMAGASANPQRNYRGDLQVMAYKVGHSGMTDGYIAALYDAWASSPTLPPPPPQGPEFYELDLFEDDGVTVAATFSTDPDAELPYLMAPENFALQEVDFQEGRATIGGLTVEVVDVPTDAADQDSGAVTALLAATIGRRMHLKYWDGSAFQNVINGVIADIALHDSYSSFTFTLNDIRAKELDVTLFAEANTATVLPRGVLEGFGYNADTDTWLIAPTEPFTVRYLENVFPDRIIGTLDFPRRADRVPLWQVITPTMAKAIDNATIGADGFWKYASIKLYWREVGGVDWYVVDNMGYAGTVGAAGTYRDSAGVVHDVRYIESLQFRWPPGATPRPDSGDDIEAILAYKGPPSEDYPLHVEGTFGSVLKDIYDEIGELYDEDAVLALSEPFLARITEPVEGEGEARAWIEENIYAPLGAVPAIDADGLISPVRDTMPAPGTELLELDDSNCEPAPAWTHTSQDVINLVSVEYTRLYPLPGDVDPLGELSAGDGLGERQQTAENDPTVPAVADSIELFGPKWLKLKPVGLSAIGNDAGEPISGDYANETGAQVAAARTYGALNRYLFGGQHYALNVMRSALGTRRVGGWCVVGCSWIPDHATGRRGPARLAQIVSLQPLDTAWAELHLVDAGPYTLPLGAPTICDTIVVNEDGSISVPVCLGAGSTLEEDLISMQPDLLHFFGEPSGTTATDSSGNGHNGTYQGTPVLGEASIIPNLTGTSARFVGSTEFVRHTFASWMETGEAKPLWSPPTGGMTNSAFPHMPCFLWFVRANNAGSFNLATISNRWLNNLLGGTDQVQTDLGAGNHHASLPSGYEDELLMIVVQKSPTSWAPGQVNNPPTEPSVPGFQSGGEVEIWVNGTLAYTATAEHGAHLGAAGDLDIMRPVSASDDINAQVFAYWTEANLTGAGIAALWAKANTDPLDVVNAECIELQYAVSDTEPAEDSPLWRFGGQRCSDGDIVIPPPPAGINVWVRIRGTKPNHAPSAWTDPVMVAGNETPGFRYAAGWLDAGSAYAAVEWEGNAFTDGVRVYYDVHQQGTTPTLSSYFDIASPPPGSYQTVVIPEAMPTDFPPYLTTIELEPYPTFSGGAVSGTPGQKLRLVVTGPGLEQNAIAYTESDGTTESRILLNEDKDLPFTRRDNTLGAIPLSSANELAVTRSDGSTIDLIPAVP